MSEVFIVAPPWFFNEEEKKKYSEADKAKYLSGEMQLLKCHNCGMRFYTQETPLKCPRCKDSSNVDNNTAPDFVKYL